MTKPVRAQPIRTSTTPLPRTRYVAHAAFVAGATEPSYFILLDWEDGRVKAIRDFRYVPYIADEAELDAMPLR